ncbi:xanthine dehydrogenase accessory protein XdhC [Photobacterium lutimaris]|uniref:Xanthine dehydrogenase accessory protein XdhC n=1 Tax=Photobacterium lutimaris TaxID=388278 RepID=A0A2T3J304_9GAMM|nr:xanthine dehydrogenase accessory protein XdhC [Photobacterium lutimaris]PSU35665.1 xanthine dehydrogenase accessory protein XdhC [Photobacterium lutimaris]TDR78725.1 molybdenum cofactor sulfurylase [Photobacterium lutimaris]
MNDDSWIHALARLDEQGEPCIMVTVLEQQGSVPRNTGTKMLVTHNEIFASIGGGHLEYQAIQIAREMLVADDTQLRTERFNLSARLGQCCGGIATLCLEPIVQPKYHLALFGAGHVAKAVVKIIASLPFNISWIDQRSDMFPAQLPPGVNPIVSDDPVSEVRQIPDGSYYLVMTHSHQLDLTLAQAILKRGDFAYFGLIGSATKCKRFTYRLDQQGFSQDTIQRMTCPVGLSEVKGKHPTEIAISIAAQVVASYQTSPPPTAEQPQ